MARMIGSTHPMRVRLITLVLSVTCMIGGIGAGGADAAESARRPEGTSGIEISRAVGKEATAFWSRQDRLAATDYHSIMPRVPAGDTVARPAVTPQGPAEVGAGNVGPAAGSPVAHGAEAARPRSVEPSIDGTQVTSATSTTSTTSASVASSGACPRR